MPYVIRINLYTRVGASLIIGCITLLLFCAGWEKDASRHSCQSSHPLGTDLEHEDRPRDSLDD